MQKDMYGNYHTPWLTEMLWNNMGFYSDDAWGGGSNAGRGNYTNYMGLTSRGILSQMRLGEKLGQNKNGELGFWRNYLFSPRDRGFIDPSATKSSLEAVSVGSGRTWITYGQNNGGGSNLGTYLSAFDFAAGVYNDYGHNHTTYKTTRGIEKSIYRANGQIRSARAAGFARASNFVRGVAVVGAIVSTTYSGYQVYDQIQTGGLQNVKGWDAADAGVGLIGLAATAGAYFGIISNPVGWVIGAGVLIYSGSRLAYDLYNKL